MAVRGERPEARPATTPIPYDVVERLLAYVREADLQAFCAPAEAGDHRLRR